MEFSVLKQVFNKKKIRIYLLVLLFFILGGEGIFSEENTNHSVSLSPYSSIQQSLFVPMKQKDFTVFCPVRYFIERQKVRKQKNFPAKEHFVIMSSGKLSASAMAILLHNNNPLIPRKEAEKIAKIYIQEAKAEGVNYDIAFSQMCLETGFLRYGGNVLPQQYNFCGLGTINKKTTGLSFRSIRLGIRAHIQHLKAYASYQKLSQPLADPRFKFVKRGSIHTIDDLTGKWATDHNYGKKIRLLLLRLYHEKV